MAKQRHITVTEAAAKLKVSTRYVRRLCQDNRLAHVEVNQRLLLIDPVSVERFTKERAPRGRPKTP